MTAAGVLGDRHASALNLEETGYRGAGNNQQPRDPVSCGCLRVKIELKISNRHTGKFSSVMSRKHRR
jgi:hypothetical protein